MSFGPEEVRDEGRGGGIEAHHVQHAAIRRVGDGESLDGADYELLRPAFLRKQSRKVWLVWSRSLVEVRPAIAAAAKQLKEALRGREMK